MPKEVALARVVMALLRRLLVMNTANVGMTRIAGETRGTSGNARFTGCYQNPYRKESPRARVRRGVPRVRSELQALAELSFRISSAVTLPQEGSACVVGIVSIPTTASISMSKATLRGRRRAVLLRLLVPMKRSWKTRGVGRMNLSDGRPVIRQALERHRVPCLSRVRGAYRMHSRPTRRRSRQRPCGPEGGEEGVRVEGVLFHPPGRN